MRDSNESGSVSCLVPGQRRQSMEETSPQSIQHLREKLTSHFGYAVIPMSLKTRLAAHLSQETLKSRISRTVTSMCIPGGRCRQTERMPRMYGSRRTSATSMGKTRALGPLAWTKHDEVTNDLRDKFGCGKEGDKHRKQEICKLGDDLFDGSSVLRGSSLKSNQVVRIWIQRLPTSVMTDRMRRDPSGIRSTSMRFELCFSNTCLSTESSAMENLKPANDWSWFVLRADKLLPLTLYLNQTEIGYKHRLEDDGGQ